MDNGVSGFIAVQQWTGNWIEVDTAGMGCCLIDTIDTGIFRELHRPWFKWELQDNISEDFYFFRLAKKNGYNLHCYTDVKLSHLGGLKVKSDGTVTIADM